MRTPPDPEVPTTNQTYETVRVARDLPHTTDSASAYSDVTYNRFIHVRKLNSRGKLYPIPMARPTNMPRTQAFLA